MGEKYEKKMKLLHQIWNILACFLTLKSFSLHADSQISSVEYKRQTKTKIIKFLDQDQYHAQDLHYSHINAAKPNLKKRLNKTYMLGKYFIK